MTRCPAASCRESTGGVALQLTESLVSRWLILLERDAYGEWATIRLRASICLARCPGCQGRFRVLPCDALPWKQYTAPVIELAVDLYRRGDLSLRRAVAQILGQRTPVHASLHGWSEGLGAFALGLAAGELPGCTPASRVLAETEARVPPVAGMREDEPAIPPERHRSEERRERLAASFLFLACATVATAGVQPPAALTEWCRRLVGWIQGTMFPLGFRSVLRCTRFDHLDRPEPPSSRSDDDDEDDGWQDHARSPPGGSNR